MMVRFYENRARIVQLLEETGTYMDLLGENPFKVRAHQNGAKIIEKYEGDLDAAIQDESIGKVKGIGPSLKEKITEFYKTEKILEYEILKKKMPPGLIEMLSLPGLGPKKVRLLA
jgi:DNA polymerase (family X)